MTHEMTSDDIELRAARSANRRAQYWKSEAMAANSVIERLESEKRDLMEALKTVEWQDEDEWENPRCHHCDCRKDYGHATNCKVGNALKL